MSFLNRLIDFWRQAGTDSTLRDAAFYQREAQGAYYDDQHHQGGRIAQG